MHSTRCRAAERNHDTKIIHMSVDKICARPADLIHCRPAQRPTRDRRDLVAASGDAGPRCTKTSAARVGTASRNVRAICLGSNLGRHCAPTAALVRLFAYVRPVRCRRIGLAHTEFTDATCGSIRLKPMKLAGLVRVSARRTNSRSPRLAHMPTNGGWPPPDWR